MIDIPGHWTEDLIIAMTLRALEVIMGENQECEKTGQR